MKDAERFAEEDKKQKEAVDTKNQAENLIYQSEKALTDIGDKVSESEKSEVNAAIAKLKETLKGDNTDAIKADTEELQKKFYALSEKLYKQQGGDPGSQGGPEQGGGSGSQGSDGYYNADFEDKTGDNK